MKKKLLILVAAVMLVLAACGSKPGLAKWVDGEDITAAEDQLNSMYNPIGLKADFSAEGDDILVFSVTYLDQLDTGDLTQSEIDALYAGQMDPLASTMTPMFEACKQETGVTLKCIRVKYINADGTVLYTHDFPNN